MTNTVAELEQRVAELENVVASFTDEELVHSRQDHQTVSTLVANVMHNPDAAKALMEAVTGFFLEPHSKELSLEAARRDLAQAQMALGGAV